MESKTKRRKIIALTIVVAAAISLCGALLYILNQPPMDKDLLELQPDDVVSIKGRLLAFPPDFRETDFYDLSPDRKSVV